MVGLNGRNQKGRDRRKRSPKWLLIMGAFVSVLLVGVAPGRGQSGPTMGLRRPPSALGTWMRSDLFGGWDSGRQPRYSAPLIADRFDSRVYARANSDSLGLGLVRKGTVLWGRPADSRKGCRAGWYGLAQGGYACASGSFQLAETHTRPNDGVAPNLSTALPYRYGQVITDGAPRFNRLPTADEEAAAMAGDDDAEVLDVRMEGDYFIAIADEQEEGDRRFYRTIRDKYVRTNAVELTKRTAMHGARLREGSLPLAFVIESEAPTFRVHNNDAHRVGTAAHYARYGGAHVVDLGDQQYVVDGTGIGIAREYARIARAIERPDEIADDEKWIHVNLTEQTLVAYEGDAPVFATLVSSGKPGYDTPTGLYRILHKHVSTTMTGDDPTDGHYEVEDVPWTMYYFRSYALHGAYWHDSFGRVRSHGCTNLPPADARWLVHWTGPELPHGWHSVRAQRREHGTAVYFTRDASEDESP